jgi:hypothetical protein
MAKASSTQVAPAQEAGRPQPQTTVEPAGGPFIRHSQPGRRAQYVVSGTAFAGLITQPLVATPGYLRQLRLTISATAGTSTGTPAGNADAPFNVVALVTLKDAFGTPLVVGPGWEMLYAVPKYSAQYGLLAAADIKSMPSYSAIQTTTGTGAGNFSFSTALSTEFAKAYGVISMANAALLPTLQIQYATSGIVYSTAPTTLPVLNAQLDADFYWLPEGVDIEPPGLGTTCQWVLQNCNPSISSVSATAVSLPRLGGFLHTLLFILRDSTGARIDAWGTRIRIYIDGVPLIDTTFVELQDDIYNVYGGISRDTGLIAISRRTSLSQINLGLFDTGEVFLSTNPGTLIQFECTPWGTIANAPAQLEAIVGQVVPAGALLQGLPEL